MLLHFVLTTFLAGFALAGIPSYFQVCGRKNPDLNNCVLRSVDNIRHKLKTGIPELDVPSLEPMLLDEIVLANDPSFKAIAQKVKLHGFSDFRPTNLKVDLANKRIDIEVAFDKIRLDAEYDVATRVVVPIAGQGPIDIVAEDVTAKVTLKYQLVDHKGGKYLYFSTMTTKLYMRDYTSHFVSREGSDGALAEGINAALSGDRQEIIKTITPNLEKTISTRVLELANIICKNFKYDELFPDHE